jgi:hypothetical protein
MDPEHWLNIKYIHQKPPIKIVHCVAGGGELQAPAGGDGACPEDFRGSRSDASDPAVARLQAAARVSRHQLQLQAGDDRHLLQLCQGALLLFIRVADPHSFYLDPDPAF